METNTVNDWMRRCTVQGRMDFVPANGGNFSPFACLESHIRRALIEFPWEVKERGRTRSAVFRVRQLDFGLSGKHELLLEGHLKFSQIYPFQRYLEGIAQKLADLQLPQVANVATRIEIEGERVAKSFSS